MTWSVLEPDRHVSATQGLRRSLGLISSVLMAAGFLFVGHPEPSFAQSPPSFVPGEIIVGYHSEAERQAAQASAEVERAEGASREAAEDEPTSGR